MANRTVSVRYILDASGYRSGANDIAAADQRIAASARAAAAAMDQQQAKVARGQQKATQAYVAGGKAQADAVTKVGKASTASARIMEDASRRQVRVQEDAAQKIVKAKSEQARQEIASQSALRQARIREDAEVKASRAAESAASAQATATAKTQASQQANAAKAATQAKIAQQRAAEQSIKAQLRESDQASRAATQAAAQEQRASASRARTVQQATLGQQRLEIRAAAAEKMVAANKAKAAREQETAFRQSGQAASQVGHTALLTGGLIAAGLGLSARAAIQWQSDFTGVRKTVNGSNEQLGALETQLRGLSRTMPETSTQIASIAENAGQLGIQTGSISAFTKTIVQLGDTTNLSTDEASTGLAQLGNIMGTLDGPASQVNDTISRTASTIVGLGNNGASTEKDILSLGLRIAGAGRAIGLNTGEVLGFSSAIASTGVEAEAGGTGFSNFAFKVDAAVRSGGPKLNLLAKTAGVTSDQFQKAYGQDSAQAITSFIEGLGKAQAAGEDTNATLKGLGVTGIREADVIRRLALSGKLLSDNLAEQKKAYGENNALSNEASKRYQTDAARIQIAVNKIKDDAIDIGAATLPVISAVTDKVSDYADAFKRLSPGTQGNLVKGGAAAASILIVGGAALAAAGSVANLASNLKTLSGSRTAAGLSGIGKALGVVAVAALALTAAGGLTKALQIPETNFKTDLVGLTSSLEQFAKVPTANLDDKFKLKDATTSDSVDSLASAFQRLNQSKGFQGVYDSANEGLDSFFGTSSVTGKIKQQIDGIDKSLTGFVQGGNAKEASNAFAKITKTAQLQGRSLIDLAGDFPNYIKAVGDATSANGYNAASQEELVEIAGGKFPQALVDAAKKNADLKNAVNAVTGANIGQTKSFAEQLSAMQKTTNTALGLRSAHSSMEGAIDQASAAIKQNGKTLDVNTEKGRQNRTALDNVVVGTANYVKTLGDQHRSALQLVETNERGRQSYIKLATAAGQSKSGAIRDANSLFKLPKSVTTQVVVDVKGSGTKKQIHDLNVDIQKLPKEKRAKIVTIAEDKGIKAAKSAIKDITSKPKTQKIKTEYEKGKKPPTPKPIKQKILNQFSTEKTPTPKALTQHIKQVVDRADVGDVRGSKASRTITFNSKVTGPKAAPTPKGGTVKFKSEVSPPKTPVAPKGKTVTFKSKVDAPKAPKPPKGATITYKVKVDKTAKVPVPKGGTVKIKTAVDLSGVQRAKAGVSSVKGKSVSIKTNANLGGVSAARSAIASLPSSKTITITTVKREVTKKAGGGKVNGPGTSTSDSIDAKLSDQEWVIQASSSKRYGDGIMAALNAGSVPRSALEPYAYSTGGKAGLPPMAFASGGKASLSDVMRFVNSPNDFFADIISASKDAAKGLKAVAKAEKDIRKARKDQRDADTKSEKRKADAEYKKATKELASAQKKYKDTLGAVTDAQKAAAETIRSYADGLTKNYRSASTSGADLLALQKQGAADLGALDVKLDALRKAGLNDSEIARIAQRAQEGDVAGASALADSILAGGRGLVDQLNRANAALEKIADNLASDTVTKKTRGLATGGQASGPGTATSDTAGLFALSNREWVHPVAAVDYYGEAFMAAVQNRTLPKTRVAGYMANGGGVGVKVVTAPSNTADFIRALEGVAVMVQSPITGEYLRGHIAGIAQQQIGATLTGAGSSR